MNKIFTKLDQLKNDNMKKIILVLLSTVIMTGCKSWDASQIGVKKEPASPKLLTLDKKIEDVANATVLTSEDRMKLFSKEVEENLTDPYGNKYGSIIMKQNIINQKMGMGWALLNGFTVFVPSIFGCPFAVVKYKIEIEFRIMDSQNKLIGKYSAIGNSKVAAALYWGYTPKNAMRKSYVDALNNAFDQIRPQIKADISRLNEQLQAAGKIN
jgi:hypothetical protein